MVVSADFVEHTGDDARRLEALRQFGRTLPNARMYERHPGVILAWVAGTVPSPQQAPTLWPTCDFKECVRPEHQLGAVPLHTAIAEQRVA